MKIIDLYNMFYNIKTSKSSNLSVLYVEQNENVFTKSVQIDELSIELNSDIYSSEYLSINSIIRYLIEKKHREKIKEIGYNNKVDESCDSVLDFIEKQKFEYCIGNQKTINLLSLKNIIKYSTLIEDDDIIIFGKKTNVDFPGVIVVVLVDENDNIVYKIENNILTVRASIVNIGFFPEKNYFTYLS